MYAALDIKAQYKKGERTREVARTTTTHKSRRRCGSGSLDFAKNIRGYTQFNGVAQYALLSQSIHIVFHEEHPE